MSGDLERSVGELHGKVDALMVAFKDYAAEHNRRHEILDGEMKEVQAHVNRVRGVHTLLMAFAGAIGSAITLAVQKLLR